MEILTLGRAQKICNLLDLGGIAVDPVRVMGGLLHYMWKIEASTGDYAVKQLSQDFELTPENIQNLNRTEDIATSFNRLGIRSVHALANGEGEKVLLCDGGAFLVYPWVDASTIGMNEVSERHALKMAPVLARLHLANLVVPELTEAQFDVCGNNEIIKLVSRAVAAGLPYADKIAGLGGEILNVNKDYQECLPVLKSLSVVSHGDLDQKNVLWDSSQNPILIDWESARRLNPMQEILDVALNWSGVASGSFNRELFVRILENYQEQGGKLEEKYLKPAYLGVLGNWINWMVYNIKRSLKTGIADREEQALGVAQVEQVLNTFELIQRLRS